VINALVRFAAPSPGSGWRFAGPVSWFKALRQVHPVPGPTDEIQGNAPQERVAAA